MQLLTLFFCRPSFQGVTRRSFSSSTIYERLSKNFSNLTESQAKKSILNLRDKKFEPIEKTLHKAQLQESKHFGDPTPQAAFDQQIQNIRRENEKN